MTFSTIRSTLEGAPLRYTRFKVSLKLKHSSLRRLSDFKNLTQKCRYTIFALRADPEKPVNVDPGLTIRGYTIGKRIHRATQKA